MHLFLFLNLQRRRGARTCSRFAARCSGNLLLLVSAMRRGKSVCFSLPALRFGKRESWRRNEMFSSERLSCPPHFSTVIAGEQAALSLPCMQALRFHCLHSSKVLSLRFFHPNPPILYLFSQLLPGKAVRHVSRCRAARGSVRPHIIRQQMRRKSKAP